MPALQKPTRRNVLIAGTGMLVAAPLLEGCSFFDTDPSGEKEPKANAPDGKESPMLAEQVEAGKLPPVEQRLPEKPAELEPYEELGKYGGTLRQTSPDRVSSPFSAGIVEWDPVSLEPIPAVAEDVEVSDDGTVFTIHLRSGLKWSDGKDFTADDVLFALNDVNLNTTLAPVMPDWLSDDGKPVKVTKVDDVTVELEFATAQALFLRIAAFSHGSFFFPKHYLSQFHGDYAKKSTLAKAVKDAGFETWDQLFNAKASLWDNVDLPVMNPWKVEEPVDASGGGHVVLTRNPYYWKVDSEGRQLPYIDHFTVDIMNEELGALRAADGGIDLQATRISYKNVPVLTRSAEEKGYEVLHWKGTAVWISMYLNQSAKDPAIRSLMQNIDFRAALSHAIDRDEMNETLYAGQGGTLQPVAVPEDPYFVEGSGKTFTSYEPDKANALLDGVGMSKRDSDGFRLRPDGKELNLLIKTFEHETGVNAVDAYQMVKQYWEKVGVRTTVKVLEASLWSTDVQNGDADIAGYTVAGIFWDIDNSWYVPTHKYTYWAPLYGLWYETGGEQGEEPPPDLRRLQELYDEMTLEMDEGKRLELGQEILKAHDENVWIIGTVTIPFWPVIASADMVNVRDDAVETYVLGHEQATRVEQVAYKHPEDH